MADLAHAAEGDTDLHGDPDARHWAERFAAKFMICALDGGVLSNTDAEGLMLAWFAGAIETGKMALPRLETRKPLTAAEVEETRKRWQASLPGRVDFERFTDEPDLIAVIKGIAALESSAFLTQAEGTQLNDLRRILTERWPSVGQAVVMAYMTDNYGDRPQLVHDLNMPHDLRYGSNTTAGCPPNCPAHAQIERDRG